MARRKAVLLSLGVVGAALAWGTPAAAAVPTPTVHQGDVTTCEAAGLAGTIQASGEAPDEPGGIAPDFGSTTTGATVDVDHLSSGSDTYGRVLDVTVEVGWHMTGVVVAGGGAYHLYAGLFYPPLDASLPGLTAPPQSGTNPIISRYFVCGQKDAVADETTHDGDVTTCAEAGLAGSILVAAAAEGGSLPDRGHPDSGTVADVNQLSGDPLNGRELSVKTEPGYTLSGIVVAGDGAYKLYAGPFAGLVFIPHLVAPLEGGIAPLIQHYFVCGGPNPVPTTPTTTTPTTTTPTTTTTTTTTAPALADTGDTPSSAAMIGLVSAGAALVAAGAAVLLVLRRRRAMTGA